MQKGVILIENGFYKISQEFITLVNTRIGGKYHDNKSRPIFCCMKDKYIKGLFWAIPTSDLSHRTKSQVDKIRNYCKLDMNKDIRSCWYHIGHTNRPAIYRVSSCLPITDKYISGVYLSKGSQLFLKSKNDIKIIRKKLGRILFDEEMHPNKYEQHITDIRNYLKNELTI